MSEVFHANFLFTVLVVVVGCGFQYGYHFYIVGFSSETFENWVKSAKDERLGKNISSEAEISVLWTTIDAVYPLGGVLGALLTGYFSEMCGRKKSFFWNNMLLLAANVMSASSKFSRTFELFMIARFLIGIGVGLNSGLSQIYLVEIAPDKMRGRVAGLTTFSVIFFAIIAQMIGMGLGTEKDWPFMFVISSIPCCIQVVCLLFIPESPKHLVIHKGKDKKAEKALMWLRGTNDVETEMATIFREDNLVKEMHAVTLNQIFVDVRLRTPLTVCVVLFLAQEISGINCVLLFSLNNFHDIGFTMEASVYITIIMSLWMLIIVVIGLFLIDKVGRRLLLLISFLGMAFATAGLTVTLLKSKEQNSADGWKYAGVVFHYIFVAFYTIGCGIVIDFISAE